MRSLDATETRQAEAARDLLADLFGKTYRAVPDMAADFGRLEVHARTLLDIIDSISGRES